MNLTLKVEEKQTLPVMISFLKLIIYAENIFTYA